MRPAPDHGHDGHLLVVPRVHVPDAVTDPEVTASTFRRAAELAGDYGDGHLITNFGAAAEQTVLHLHVHVVPRRVGDGLLMPWTTAGRRSLAGRS